MHDLEFEHLHVDPADAAVNEVAWAADNVELTTVGIDIGSSTSHLMFARVHLQRLSAALSSRFVVVERKILWQSPILLTPYRPDYTIDVDELAGFIGGCYAYAGIARETIDSGKPATPFMAFGDRIRIEMFDRAGQSIFGAIDQKVARYTP